MPALLALGLASPVFNLRCYVVYFLSDVTRFKRKLNSRNVSFDWNERKVPCSRLSDNFDKILKKKKKKKKKEKERGETRKVERTISGGESSNKKLKGLFRRIYK